MAFVVVNLASEYLPDGSFHIYSPNVPGFHVVEKNREISPDQLMRDRAMPLLRETLSRRIAEAKVGGEVRIHDLAIEITNFVPSELRRCLGDKDTRRLPTQLIAEIVG